MVLREGAQATPEALQAHCRQHMARHKMPKYVQVLGELPMTANGKIQKFALRQHAAAVIADGSLRPVRA